MDYIYKDYHSLLNYFEFKKRENFYINQCKILGMNFNNHNHNVIIL